jgi:AcrR family transcriptional regulator
MNPRRRKAEDADVFSARVRVMLRRGPAELTLREIAREAGITAGALVQRFGSKRAMLLAHARYAAATGDAGLPVSTPGAKLRTSKRQPILPVGLDEGTSLGGRQLRGALGTAGLVHELLAESVITSLLAQTGTIRPQPSDSTCIRSPSSPDPPIS